MTVLCVVSEGVQIQASATVLDFYVSIILPAFYFVKLDFM